MAFRSDDVELAREAWRPWIVVAAMVAATVLFALALLFVGKAAGLGVVVASGAAIGLLLRAPPFRRGAVLAQRDGLWFNDRMVVGRAQLSTAEVDGHHVRLERSDRQGTIRLRARSARDARAVVEALELDAAHAAARFLIDGGARTFGPMVVAATGAVAALVGALAPSTVIAIIGALAFIGVILRALLERASVSVGTDGILIERYGRGRFVAFRDIVRVQSIQADPEYVTGSRSWAYLQIALSSGGNIRVAVEQPHSKSEHERIAPALVQRINEAMRLADHRPSAGLDERIVQRSGRTPAQWLASLRALAAPAAYRMRALSEEGLWRILGDPRCEASARVGALVALQSLTRGRDRERLRIAVETIAEPRLQRIMRVAAAAEEDDALLAALEEVEQQDDTAS